MGTPGFDPDSSTNGMLRSAWEPPSDHLRRGEDMAQATADLLQQKSLISRFGNQGEWEVRTTLVANRQAWRYHSSVYLYGKERKKGFPPINVDRTREIRQNGAITEELLTAFAKEAVEVHIARCDGIKEYLTLAPFFTQPETRYQWTKRLVVLLLAAAVLMATYWWWKGLPTLGPILPDRQLVSPRIQWQPSQISHQLRGGEPFEFPLPRLERLPEGVAVEVTLETSGDPPTWIQLDREQLRIHGTAPLAAASQIHRFYVQAHSSAGVSSRLLIVLTIIAPPEQSAPVRQLPGHWAW
jgi:hypothetical protein